MKVILQRTDKTRNKRIIPLRTIDNAYRQDLVSVYREWC